MPPLPFKKYYEQKRTLVNRELKKLFTGKNIPSRLLAAEKYSLYAGGKRIRPVLLLMTDAAIGNRIPSSDILKMASALELIHTYSLIHDDLPAMDDDDLRRGLPTSHKKYDEATAILAGDGLLTLAFELMSSLTAKNKNISQSSRYLAKAAGQEGMVGGQVLDLENENKKISLAGLKKIHRMKTGALLDASVLLPVIYHKRKLLENPLGKYAASIGLAFQIYDDILDVTATTEELGKDAGSDESNQKSTYVGLLGLEGARKAGKDEINKAVKALNTKNIDGNYLAELAGYIGSRKN